MKAEKYRVALVVSSKYRVTALNVTRIWIKLASRLMMGGRGNFSLFLVTLYVTMPSPGTWVGLTYM